MTVITVQAPDPPTDRERKEAVEWIRRARFHLSDAHPFFAYASWKLTLREDDALPTLATDGQSLFYNPAYVCRTAGKDITGKDYPNYKYAETEVAHEALHCLLRHTAHDWAKKGYDAELVNVAQDHVINLMLKKLGFVIPGCYGTISVGSRTVPCPYPTHPHPAWCCDDRFDGMTWFQVYDVLLKERQQNPQHGKT